MKKAFTLIELLVVISIIGILSGVMIASFSGGTESARAAKCLNNMRNLAQGALTYGASSPHKNMPLAGSRAAVGFNENGTQYEEQKGWISWLSINDEYHARTRGSKPTSFISVENASAYTTDEKKGLFAVTNGTLWRAVNFNHESYLCPAHQKAVQKKGGKVWWSYVMNAYFGYDWSKGSKAPVTVGDVGKSMSDVNVRPDKRLLFAELPIYGTGARFDEGGSANTATYPASGGTECDCVLQYKAYEFQRKWSGTAESIAFNHKSNKKFVAHVVFADGHAEKLQKPRSGGITDEQLTALLCSGKDIGYDGKVYTWVNDTDKTE